MHYIFSKWNLQYSKSWTFLRVICEYFSFGVSRFISQPRSKTRFVCWPLMFAGSLGWHAVCVAGFWDSWKPNGGPERRVRHWRRMRVRLASRHRQLMGFPLALPQDGLARPVSLLGSDPLLRLCSLENPHRISQSIVFGNSLFLLMDERNIVSVCRWQP